MVEEPFAHPRNRLTGMTLARLFGRWQQAAETLAFELRVRARWIEGARQDEGVSQDRRMGIAAIEDVEVQS
ncbi:MAG TPA: hypothetical protein VMT03_14825 [Polyangia bacterium]|nr:hypothetical protein [Polyangia bacterium]